jgi:hypothetical protein
MMVRTLPSGKNELLFVQRLESALSKGLARIDIDEWRTKEKVCFSDAPAM